MWHVAVVVCYWSGWTAVHIRKQLRDWCEDWCGIAVDSEGKLRPPSRQNCKVSWSHVTDWSTVFIIIIIARHLLESDASVLKEFLFSSVLYRVESCFRLAVIQFVNFWIRYWLHIAISFCCSCSCWGDLFKNSLRLRCFKSDRDEIWQNCSWSKFASIDRVRFSVWCHTFMLAAVTSFDAEKCCHLVSRHAASARRLCSSMRQFMIHTAFIVLPSLCCH